MALDEEEFGVTEPATVPVTVPVVSEPTVEIASGTEEVTEVVVAETETMADQVTAPAVDEAELKRLKRAERFGIPVVAPQETAKTKKGKNGKKGGEKRVLSQEEVNGFDPYTLFVCVFVIAHNVFVRRRKRKLE